MTIKIGEKVTQRLRSELIIWLTTVRPDGMPQPTPVWFLWDGECFLIYSQAGTRKLRNIAHSACVALNLNSDDEGSEIVVFTGAATIDDAAPSVDKNVAYRAKYREGIAQIGLTPESMARDYCVAIRVRPTRVRQ